MTNQSLKDFASNIDTAVALEKEAHEEARKAQVRGLINEASLAATRTPPNYNNPQEIANYAGQASAVKIDTAYTTLKERKDEILHSIAPAKLEQLLLSFPLADASKEVAERHGKAQQYLKLLQGFHDEEGNVSLENGNYKEVVKLVVPELDSLVPESLAVVYKGIRLSPETIKLARQNAEYSISSRKDAGFYSLRVLVDREKAELIKAIGGEKEVKPYNIGKISQLIDGAESLEDKTKIVRTLRAAA